MLEQPLALWLGQAHDAPAARLSNWPLKWGGTFLWHRHQPEGSMLGSNERAIYTSARRSNERLDLTFINFINFGLIVDGFRGLC